MRRRDELLTIVARPRERGWRASPFSYGIKASRALFSELAHRSRSAVMLDKKAAAGSGHVGASAPGRCAHPAQPRCSEPPPHQRRAHKLTFRTHNFIDAKKRSTASASPPVSSCRRRKLARSACEPTTRGATTAPFSRSISLCAFENKVLRPGRRACPALPRQPHRGAALDAELAREAFAFFRPENLGVDDAAREIRLSELLNSYPEDFVPAHGANMVDDANCTLGLPLPVDDTVRFTHDDWTMVQQPH